MRRIRLWIAFLGLVLACSTFTPFSSPVPATATPTRTPRTLVGPGTTLTAAPEPTAVIRLATATLTPRPSVSPAASPTPPPSLPPATPAPPTPSLAPATAISPLAVGTAPRAYETTLILPTYGYEAGLVGTAPEDPIYPYPRLDPSRVTGPIPRSYRAVVLENDYVQIVVLPDLGGRLYRWIDKATGRHLLYENPVVKPTQWGYRGWWLAAGGIEWAFPVEEHGLNEWRPWPYSISVTASTASVSVSDTESRTGMQVGVTMTLDAAHSYITLQPWAKNPTETAHPYQLWLNAMLALHGNSMAGATQVILPADQVIVHSTGDGSLPGAWEGMTWPVHNGRDMSWLSNWSAYLGFFAPSVRDGFVGVYDYELDQGIVRIFAPGWPAGTKVFGPASLPPSLWTDDGSTYLELWSGATRTFADYAVLEPGAGVGWSEHWYPVAGLGGLGYANQAAALQLTVTGESVDVGVAVTSATAGWVTLWAGGIEVMEWEANLLPGQAFRARWTRLADATGPFGARYETAAGVMAELSGIP